MFYKSIQKKDWFKCSQRHRGFTSFPLCTLNSHRYRHACAHRLEFSWSFYFLKKAREFQRNIYFCFTHCARAFDCGITTTWKILQEMGIPDHLTCLLRNPYAGQEATVRTGHGTTDWFPVGKGVVKAVYFHHAYLTYMQSTSCEMASWLKHKLETIAGRNINNLWHTDDPTLIAESKEELRTSWWKWKRRVKKLA